MAHTKAPLFDGTFASVPTTFKLSTIGDGGTMTAVANRLRLTWTSTIAAGVTLSMTGGPVTGDATTGWVDGEIEATIPAGNGTGTRSGVHARLFNTSGNIVDGYILREKTHGDPTVWELIDYSKDTSNVETIVVLATLVDPAITYPAKVALSCIGSTLRAKIWSGATEPAWNAPGRSCKVTDTANSTLGAWGCAAFDLAGAGEYCEFDSAKITLANSILIGLAGNTSDTASNSTGPYNISVTCPANTPLLIIIAVCRNGVTPDAPTFSPPSGMTVGGVLGDSGGYDTSATPSKRLLVYPAMSNVAQAAATLAVSFANAVIGFNGAVVRCSNADNSAADGSAGFTHVTDPAPVNSNATTMTITLPAFTNAVGVSSTIGAIAHSVAEGLGVGSGFVQLTSLAHITPTNAVMIEARPDNDTVIDHAAGTSSRYAGIGAEVECGDWQTAEYLVRNSIVVPPLGRFRKNRALLRR